MKTLKTFFISTVTLFSSCLLLTGCGSSKEESKDATPQSAESASSSSENRSDSNAKVTLKTPFNRDKPIYVTGNDDENMHVKAIVTPYLDTKDKVKVELYDTGDLQKTLIVDYKITQLQKGSKDKLDLYRYTFYENDSEENKEHNYITTIMTRTDLNNEPFIWIYPLDKDEKDLSDKEVRKLCRQHYGNLMTDESDTVTLK